MPTSFHSRLLLFVTISSIFATHGSHAFVVTPTPSSLSFSTATTTATAVARSSTTRLFIEKHIADMIDQELWREQHKKEFEHEWMKKNRGAIFHALQKSENDGDANSGGSASNLMLSDPAEDYRQYRKDKILAANDPMRYCADRCVSTGSCEVFEDIFNFTPQQVMEFCTDCVLSNGEEPCELPESFFDMLEDGPDQLQL
jgi:hypothetical protein